MPVETSVIQLGQQWRPFDNQGDLQAVYDYPLMSPDSILEDYGKIFAKLYPFGIDAHDLLQMRELVQTKENILVLFRRPLLYAVMIGLSPSGDTSVDDSFQNEMARMSNNSNPARGRYARLNCNLQVGGRSHSSLGRLDSLNLSDLKAAVFNEDFEITFREFSLHPNMPILRRPVNPQHVFTLTASLAQARNLTFTFSEPSNSPRDR